MGYDTERLEQPRVRSQVVGGDAWQHGLTPNFGGTAELAAAVTSAPIVHADINDGTLLRYGTAGAADERYVARVQMYMVPPVTEGPAGCPKVFHRDYRHYKYYGFGGKGAKTSWAHNPKYSVLYEEEPLHYRIATLYNPNSNGSSDTQDLAAATVQRTPLRETMDGPIRQLTPAEKLLVREFRTHSYSYDGQPSLDERARKGGGAHTLTPGTSSQHPSTTGSLVSAKQLQAARQHGSPQQQRQHQPHRQHQHAHHFGQQPQYPTEPTLSWGWHDNMYGTMYQ